MTADKHFAQGSITFTADVPQEAIDKVLANTKEDMDKWLKSGNTFDLSDGADRTVAYISFPKDTKPEDVVRVVRCKECIHRNDDGTCEEDTGDPYSLARESWKDDWFCANGERKEPHDRKHFQRDRRSM